MPSHSFSSTFLPQISEQKRSPSFFITGVTELRERIQQSYKRLSFLLDVHLFSAEDVKLNSSVMTWPRKIQPIFLQHDDVRRLIDRSLVSRLILSLAAEMRCFWRQNSPEQMIM